MLTNKVTNHLSIAEGYRNELWGGLTCCNIVQHSHVTDDLTGDIIQPLLASVEPLCRLMKAAVLVLSSTCCLSALQG